MNFFIDVLMVAMGLLFISYVIYGRRTHKSLIGNQKPGTPGYDAFWKLVTTPRYLIISCMVTAIFGVVTVVDALAILHSDSPHSILVLAPIMVAVILFMTISIIPPMLRK